MRGKKILSLLSMGWVLVAAPVWSGNVGVGININIGAPVVVPIIVPEPPLFLAPAPLGFQVAVGVPYDLCMVDGRYYLLHGNVWHVGFGYNGPWHVVQHDHLPPGLRKHKMHDIRSYRDHEYVAYKKGKDHYRGRSYRPDRYHRDRDHDQDRDRDHRGDHDRGHDRGHGEGHGNGHGKGRWD